MFLQSIVHQEKAHSLSLMWHLLNLKPKKQFIPCRCYLSHHQGALHLHLCPCFSSYSVWQLVLLLVPARWINNSHSILLANVTTICPPTCPSFMPSLPHPPPIPNMPSDVTPHTVQTFVHLTQHSSFPLHCTPLVAHMPWQNVSSVSSFILPTQFDICPVNVSGLPCCTTV